MDNKIRKLIKKYLYSSKKIIKIYYWKDEKYPRGKSIKIRELFLWFKYNNCPSSNLNRETIYMLIDMVKKFIASIENLLDLESQFFEDLKQRKGWINIFSFEKINIENINKLDNAIEDFLKKSKIGYIVNIYSTFSSEISNYVKEFISIKNFVDEESLKLKESLLSSIKNKMDFYFKKETKINESKFISLNNSEFKHFVQNIFSHFGSKSIKVNDEITKNKYRFFSLEEKHAILNDVFNTFIYIIFSLNKGGN